MKQETLKIFVYETFKIKEKKKFPFLRVVKKFNIIKNNILELIDTLFLNVKNYSRPPTKILLELLDVKTLAISG